MAFDGVSDNSTGNGESKRKPHPGVHCSQEEQKRWVESWQAVWDEISLGAVSRGRDPPAVLALTIRDLDDRDISELPESAGPAPCAARKAMRAEIRSKNATNNAQRDELLLDARNKMASLLYSACVDSAEMLIEPLRTKHNSVNA